MKLQLGHSRKPRFAVLRCLEIAIYAEGIVDLCSFCDVWTALCFKDSMNLQHPWAGILPNSRTSMFSLSAARTALSAKQFYIFNLEIWPQLTFAVSLLYARAKSQAVLYLNEC